MLVLTKASFPMVLDDIKFHVRSLTDYKPSRTHSVVHSAGKALGIILTRLHRKTQDYNIC